METISLVELAERKFEKINPFGVGRVVNQGLTRKSGSGSLWAAPPEKPDNTLSCMLKL